MNKTKLVELPAYLAGKKAIHFVQFMRPDGRRVDQWLVEPSEIDSIIWAEAVATADQINAFGYEFQMEHIPAGNRASLAVSGYSPDIDEEADIVHIICANGPSVPHKVVQLVNEAAEKLKKWGLFDGDMGG